jgi:uncharacterized membrane protein
MRIPALLTVLVLAAMPTIACDDDDDGEAEADDEADAEDDAGDCEAPDAPRYDDVQIFATCTMCHASTLVGDARNGALASVNFDTAEAAMMAAARGLERVNAGAMPPPASGLSVTRDEIDELERWVLCGTP